MITLKLILLKCLVNSKTWTKYFSKNIIFFKKIMATTIIAIISHTEYIRLLTKNIHSLVFCTILEFGGPRRKICHIFENFMCLQNITSFGVVIKHKIIIAKIAYFFVLFRQISVFLPNKRWCIQVFTTDRQFFLKIYYIFRSIVDNKREQY